MICPNCGRRNPAGATFCSRCRQRLPLAARYSGGHRRAILAEPSGGGGGGALVLGVALLAGFLFIGGGAAIYLSSPQQPTAPATAVAGASAGRSLDVFVQETPTPLPTPVPTPTPLPTIDPFATPTIDPFASPSPSFGVITPTPTATETPTDAPAGPQARFAAAQREGTLRVIFTDRSTGDITGWSWDFGDGSSSTERNPRHTYGSPGEYRVVLTVAGPNGADDRTRRVTVAPLATPTPTPSPTPTKTPAPTDTPTPTITPEPTPTASPTPIGSPPAPDANFTWQQVAGTLVVTFTNKSSGIANSYEWDFGDGSQKVVKSGKGSVTHPYEVGVYPRVALTAIGPGGQNTHTDVVEVDPVGGVRRRWVVWT